MTNIVMAIALWCGNPTFNPGIPSHSIYKQDVNQCREELFKCVEKDPNGTKFLECFKNKKL